MVASGQLIEAYAAFAEEQIPDLKELHTALALAAVGLATRNTFVPKVSGRGTRQLIFAVMPAGYGKGASVKLAKRTILSPLPVLEIASGSMEGLAEELSRRLSPPFLVMDEFAVLLKREYSSSITKLIRKAYDGDRWIHMVREKPYAVPQERMRLCLAAFTTPADLTDALEEVDVGSGFLPRLVLIVRNPGEYDETERFFSIADVFRVDRIFAEALHYISINTPDSVAIDNCRNHAKNVLRDLSQAFGDGLFEVKARLGEHLVSVAAAHAVARLDEEITREDITFAADFIRETIIASKPLLSQIVGRQHTFEQKVADLADKIEQKVQEQGGRAKRRDVLRSLHIAAALADKAEKLLLMEERVAVYRDGRRRYYCIPDESKCDECPFRSTCSFIVQRL